MISLPNIEILTQPRRGSSGQVITRPALGTRSRGLRLASDRAAMHAAATEARRPSAQTAGSKSPHDLFPPLELLLELPPRLPTTGHFERLVHLESRSAFAFALSSDERSAAFASVLRTAATSPAASAAPHPGSTCSTRFRWSVGGRSAEAVARRRPPLGRLRFGRLPAGKRAVGGPVGKLPAERLPGGPPAGELPHEPLPNQSGFSGELPAEKLPAEQLPAEKLLRDAPPASGLPLARLAGEKPPSSGAELGGNSGGDAGGKRMSGWHLAGEHVGARLLGDAVGEAAPGDRL